MTQRNVAAWISGINGYMNARNKKEKERHRSSIREMTEKEIENSEVLIKILDSGIEFMTCADKERHRWCTE